MASDVCQALDDGDIADQFIDVAATVPPPGASSSQELREEEEGGSEGDGGGSRAGAGAGNGTGEQGASATAHHTKWGSASVEVKGVTNGNVLLIPAKP
jgi:hypothetical protein